MCCFLMVTTIWDNPRNTIKNAFNSLFEGLKNKMHEQHAQLTHLNPAKRWSILSTWMVNMKRWLVS